MQAFRVTPLIVAIVGSVLCILAPILIFFLLIKPTNEKIAAQQAIYDQNAAFVGPGPLHEAQKKLDDATKDLKQTQAQWDFIMKTKNPLIDVSDRIVGWKEQNAEIEGTLYPLLNKFWLRNVYAKKRDPNVAIPLGELGYSMTPSSNPNDVKASPLTIPILMSPWTGTPGEQAMGGGATIQVIGTLQADLDNVAQWNKFSRIVQVDGLTLQGYSPFIKATYSAKMYEFYTNADKPGPDVPTSSK